jgi:hypothetical protein
VSDVARPPRTANAALALRLAGASYAEVTDALGLTSVQAAREQVEAALAWRAWDDRDGRERMRAENGARLERLLRSVWTKATDAADPEHLPAVKVARELIDRYAKLYGLDAPAEIVIHNPTASEIETWVATVVGQQSESLRAMEAAIIEDAELVDAAE